MAIPAKSAARRCGHCRRRRSHAKLGQRYDAAVRSHTLPPLVEIGRDIAAFLDEGDRWLDGVLAGTGEIGLEVAVPGRPEERERILLDVPWELLRIASATIATGFGDPEQEYFADGTATKNSSP